MISLGIAVTTYNRKEVLIDNLRALREFTTCAFDLVVCDDGSTDGTVDAVRGLNVPIVSGTNRGIAWNKNRALFYLQNYTAANVLIVLEDDVFPGVAGWQEDWLTAARRYGHITYATDEVRRHLIAGDCSPDNVGVSGAVSGQCMAFTREVVGYVGYFDSRFGRYGHEHTEYTNRCIRAGFGGTVWIHPDGRHQRFFFVLDGKLIVVNAVSSFDPDSVEENGIIFDAVQQEGIFRPAWRSDENMQAFMTELRSAQSTSQHTRMPPQILETDYLSLNADVRASAFPASLHYFLNGRREGRLTST